MLIHRGRSSYIDRLRDEIWVNHSQIHIVDFEFYNVDVFNQCQNSIKPEQSPKKIIFHGLKKAG